MDSNNTSVFDIDRNMSYVLQKLQENTVSSTLTLLIIAILAICYIVKVPNLQILFPRVYKLLVSIVLLIVVAIIGILSVYLLYPKPIIEVGHFFHPIDNDTYKPTYGEHLVPNVIIHHRNIQVNFDNNPDVDLIIHLITMD